MSPDDDDDAFFDYLDRTDPDPSGIPHRRIIDAYCCPEEMKIRLDAIKLVVQVEAYLASLY